MTDKCLGRLVAALETKSMKNFKGKHVVLIREPELEK